uniref:Uncharacterized protein n=1 Tax=Nothoprocta perdicaria TaxID=30464 RepID=A0A8C6ZW15_NOTPE
MEACAVRVSRTACSSVLTALAKKHVNQCCLSTLQASSYKGGEEKDPKENASDKR